MLKPFVFGFVLLVAAFAISADAASDLVDDYAFLVRHMPAKDRGVVSEAYLRATVALAQVARDSAPWRESLSDEIFREYILPYSSIGEEVDDWRPFFREKFWPLVKRCKTTGAAVQLINSQIWKILGVRYSTQRDKPHQSPFHSMRIHKASCTGLAILQICAFRACGIPARFVGCNWTPIAGNHSWVEYYDAGRWHFFNDAEDDKLQPPDQAWFTHYAAQADASSPRTRIYAARWSPGSAQFYLPWNTDPSCAIPADDVTAAYARFRPTLSQSRVAFIARDASGRRLPVAFRLIAAGSKNVLTHGRTYDESHDMNDHFIVTLPERTCAFIEVQSHDGTYYAAGRVEFGREEKLILLQPPMTAPVSRP